MTPSEATSVLTKLKAAYPSWPLDKDTAQLWLEKLKNLNHDDATLAVQSVIEDVSRFPTVADFFRHYSILREQKARDHKEEQRRLDQLAWENMPRPELREIQARPDVNEAWFQRGSTEKPLALERVGEGKCDDCGFQVRTRVRLGKFNLDEGCARRRLNAAEKAA